MNGSREDKWVELAERLRGAGGAGSAVANLLLLARLVLMLASIITCCGKWVKQCCMVRLGWRVGQHTFFRKYCNVQSNMENESPQFAKLPPSRGDSLRIACGKK